MNLSELMERLGITEYPEILHSYFEKASREYAMRGDQIVQEQHLQTLNDKYSILDQYREDVWLAAGEIRKRPEMVLYVYLLAVLLGDRDLDTKTIRDLTSGSPETTLAYDLAPLFALLEHVPAMVEGMRERNIPEDVIADTLKEFEANIHDFHDRYHRPGIRAYTWWLKMFIGLKILRIGRFNFEMKWRFNGPVNVYADEENRYRLLMENGMIHKSGMILGSAGCQDSGDAFSAELIETDEYWEGYLVSDQGLVIDQKERLWKRQWKQVLGKDDPVVSVHIPARLKLDEDICEASYDRARAVFRQCFPEFGYKAFMCQSWMMDPQLRTLLGRDTKITRFQKKYMPYPCKSAGEGVLGFVFLKADKKYDLESLPEDTSLRRAIKKHYMEGKYIYEMGGVFF